MIPCPGGRRGPNVNMSKLWQFVLILMINWEGVQAADLGPDIYQAGLDGGEKAEGPASSRGSGELRTTKGSLWGEWPVSRHERLDSHSRPLQGLNEAGEAS